MTIIISPTKTMQFKDLHQSDVRPTSDNTRIFNKLKKLSKKKIKEAYKVSDKIVDEVYGFFKDFDTNPENMALYCYQGLSFQGIKPEEYTNDMWNYAEEHLRILSAFYGPITPKTMVKPYRLDFSTDFGMDLYKFWKDIKVNGPIINLASNEYAKMIHEDMITIQFLEEENGTLKNKATYAKQARGYFVDFMIRNQITDLEDLKYFTKEGYKFKETLSQENLYVFTR